MPSSSSQNDEVGGQRATDDQLPRRLACDRCRAHKLRCLRDENSTNILNTCQRCSKAGATCLTGKSLRSGRPSKSAREKQPKSASADVPRNMGQPEVSPSWLLDWDNMLQPSPGALNEFTQHPTISGASDFPDAVFIEPFEDGTIVRDSDNLGAGGLDFESLLNMVHMNPLEKSQGHAMDIETHGSQLAEIHLEKTDLKEEVLRKLADLHSGLLADLNLMRDVGKCPCKHTARVSLASSQRNADGKTEEYDFLVGRMLNKAEAFISILQHFVSPVPNQLTPGLGGFGPESDYSDEDRDIMNEFTSWHNQTAANGSRSTSLQSPASSANIPESKLRCDVPMTLSILTCYVCLVRIYRTIFSSIHNALVVAKERKMELPPIFPGLKLGGFAPHSNFQVQILVHIGANLLNKIDETLGLPVEHGQTRKCGGILDQTGTVGLLETMMKEEAVEGLENGDPNKEAPREIFRKLRLLC